MKPSAPTPSEDQVKAVSDVMRLKKGFIRYLTQDNQLVKTIITKLITEENIGYILGLLSNLSGEYKTIKEKGALYCLVNEHNVLYDKIRAEIPEFVLEIMRDVETNPELREDKNVLNTYITILINKSTLY